MGFKPGQSGNPGGRHKLPAALSGVIFLRPTEVAALISKYIRLPFAALQEAIDKPGLPALEAAIAQQVLKAAQSGNIKALEFLLNYAGCQPSAQMQISVPNEAQISLENMTTSELLDVVRKTLPAARDLPGVQPNEVIVESVGKDEGKE